ncbi:PNGase F N-terminal domain-containing protein [Pedobacter sp. AW1-32]|uniref:PNGase F N-terminal domain-containing protein n=1 Tax=Pedobacter sp. AW1-32 TaxID=3383026 RepID=UPI003FED6BCC
MLKNVWKVKTADYIYLGFDPDMKSLYLFLPILFCSFLAIAQKPLSPANTYKITYSRSSNGKAIDEENKTIVLVTPKQNRITTTSILNGKAKFPFEQTLIVKPSNVLFQVANLDEVQQIATVDSLALTQQQFEQSNETKIILGYICKKASTVVNSNRIDFWYTTDARITAAPTALGQTLGLVLEQVRNGNSAVTATNIEVIKKASQPDVQNLVSVSTDALTYKDLLWKSRFTTLKIFNNEIINFVDKPVSTDSICRFAGGTIIARKISFPKLQNVANVFVDLTEQSNGDAYDRTGSVFVIPTDESISLLDALKKNVKVLPLYENGNGTIYQGVVATENYRPVIELMRFFTPFGVGKYNTLKLKDKTWAEKVYYRQDISELYPALNGKEVWVAVFIGNYDKGGHKVSLNITVHNAGREKPVSKKVISLFNSTNVMEMAGQEYGTMFSNDKGLEVSFTLDQDLKDAKLRYITTGHGGWGGGDEFVPKENTIWLDGRKGFCFYAMAARLWYISFV